MIFIITSSSSCMRVCSCTLLLVISDKVGNYKHKYLYIYTSRVSTVHIRTSEDTRATGRLLTSRSVTWFFFFSYSQKKKKSSTNRYSNPFGIHLVIDLLIGRGVYSEIPLIWERTRWSKLQYGCCMRGLQERESLGLSRVSYYVRSDLGI